MQSVFLKLVFAVLANGIMVSAAPAEELKNIPPPDARDIASALEIEGELSAQAIRTGTVYTGAERTGTAGALVFDVVPSNCINFAAPFDNSINSMEVFGGYHCFFWVDPGCNGNAIEIFGGSFMHNLGGSNYAFSISSVWCGTGNA